MNAELLINLNAVSFGAREVLGPVAFGCPQHSHTAIVGPNGAGKTTLLRAIAALIPCEGSVTVGGASVAELSPRRRARLIAYVPQRSSLTAPLAVRAVVAQGRFCFSGGASRQAPSDQQAVVDAMNVMEVGLLAERPFTQISGGEQRRVLIARALATGAGVLLLDEPTAGLDLRHELLLFDKLEELRAAGKVIVSVLHDLSLAERAADQLVLMRAGGSVFFGPGPLPSDLIESTYGVKRVSAPGFDYRLLS